MNIGKISGTAAMGAAFALLLGALIAPVTAQAATGNDGESSISATTVESAEPDGPEPDAPDVEASTPPQTRQEGERNSDERIESDAIESDAIAAEALPAVISVSFALSRVALIDGRSVGTPRGALSGIRSPLVAETEKDAYKVSGNWGDPGPNGIEADVAYQITMLDAPTGYWILPHVEASVESSWWPSASCHVYLGDPGAGGAVASPSPFTCDTSYPQDFPNAHVTFTVALNRAAEAQGVITTQGPVSLQSGHYEWNVPYHVNGATVVAENSSTHFDVVLRDGDAPIEPDLAQMTFIYRIVESGVARPFWIGGWSQNYRGNEFAHEGKCFVYDQDPLKATVGLKTLKPADVTPYTCTKTSERTIEYRGNYEATFTVAKRQMTDVILPEQQKALVERVCTDLTKCGVSLATVTDTFGPGRPISSVVNNTQDTADTLTIATSGSETITNSGGFEIDVSVEGKGIGWKYSTTLKFHYERSVANTTTTSESLGMIVPPHQRGWMEGTPPMVHTVGDIIVHDGDRYFNVTNVVVDFPKGKDAGGVEAKWGSTTKSEPLPPPGPDRITLEGTVTAHGGGASGEVSLVGGTYALPLNAGGPVTHLSTHGAGSVDANGSTVWSVRNVVADTAVSGGAMASGSFAYQIAAGGLPTGYWVTGSAITWNAGGSPSSSCIVYEGSPHAGGSPAAASPYQCLTTITSAGADGIVRASFAVSPATVGATPTPRPTPPPPDTAANPPSKSHVPAGYVPARLAKSGPAVDAAVSLVAILAMMTGAGLLAASAVRRARRAPSRRA